jgi:hypothetical protein
LAKVDDNNKTMGKQINTFRTEFKDFQTQIGLFADRNYIFNNHHVDLKEGRVFMWNKKKIFVQKTLDGLYVGQH